jgi:hypothetical protein
MRRNETETERLRHRPHNMETEAMSMRSVVLLERDLAAQGKIPIDGWGAPHKELIETLKLLNEFLKQAATLSVHLKPRQLKELARLTKYSSSCLDLKCGGELAFSPVAARNLTGIWKSIRPHWGEVEEGSFAQGLDAIERADQQRLVAEEAERAA